MAQDLVRILVEQAVRAAKIHTSEHTGFVTDQYGRIALYDNFLFVLALFRTKSQEHVQEGIKLLEKLLYFQQRFSDVAAHGAFSVFLHDYPLYVDLRTSIRILRVLYWLQKEFRHVLSRPFMKKIDEAIEDLAAYCKNEYEAHDLPLYLALSIEALLFAFSKIEVSRIVIQKQELALLSPEYLAECIASYHVAPTLCKYGPLWPYLTESLYVPSLLYAGPAFSLEQEGSEPKVSLYDYYMAVFKENLTKRVQGDALHVLQGALVRNAHELQEKVLPAQVHESIGEFSWSRYCKEAFSISCITGVPLAHQKRNFFPFYLVSQRHTLVMQQSVGTVEGYSYDDKKITFEVSFEKELFLQEKELPKVLCFWFDNTSSTKLTVGGEKASCIPLTESMDITLSSLQIAMTAKKLSGDGEFVWHVIRSNRPSQVSIPGAKERQKAYDVELFLRPLRATQDCRIEFVLTLGRSD